MSAQGLARGEPGQRHDAAVIIDDPDEVKGRAVLAQPAMRRSVVWPELADLLDLLDLPAAHRLARGLVWRVSGARPCGRAQRRPLARSSLRWWRRCTSGAAKLEDAGGRARRSLRSKAQTSPDQAG